MAYTRTLKMALGFVGYLLLTACSHDYQLMKTEEQLNAYGAAIRWNLFKRAVDYLATPPHPAPNWTELDQIKVTAYKPTFRDLYPSGMYATQTVEIKYIPANSVVEKTLVDEQRWRFDEARDRWVLESGLPKFELGGLEPSLPPRGLGASAPQPIWSAPRRPGSPWP
jgi:hypothetical protein